MLAGGPSTSDQGREVSKATLSAGTTPASTEPDQWKNSHLTPHTYHKVGKISRGGRGGDSNRRTSAN